jgi:hypothetical protein
MQLLKQNGQYQRIGIAGYASTFLFCVLLLATCRRPWAVNDRLLFDSPKEDEIVGTWTLDSASLDRLKSERLYKLTKTDSRDHAIVIFPDHSCFFRSYGAFQSDEDYLASKCTWKLANIDNPNGKSRQPIGVCFSSTGTDPCFWLRRDMGTLTFWTFIGDPDLQQFADFRKLPG